MIFYQQGAVVDKGLSRRHLRSERRDTAVGAILTQLIMMRWWSPSPQRSAWPTRGAVLNTVDQMSSALQAVPRCDRGQGPARRRRARRCAGGVPCGLPGRGLGNLRGVRMEPHPQRRSQPPDRQVLYHLCARSRLRRDRSCLLSFDLVEPRHRCRGDERAPAADRARVPPGPRGQSAARPSTGCTALTEWSPLGCASSLSPSGYTSCQLPLAGCEPLPPLDKALQARCVTKAATLAYGEDARHSQLPTDERGCRRRPNIPYGAAEGDRSRSRTRIGTRGIGGPEAQALMPNNCYAYLENESP